MKASIIDLINEYYKALDYEKFISRYPDGSIHKTKEEDGRYVAHLGAIFRKFHTPRGSVSGASLLDVLKSRDSELEVLDEIYDEFDCEYDTRLNLTFPLDEYVLFFTDHKDYEIIGQVPVYAKILNHDNLLNTNVFVRKIVVFIVKVLDGLSLFKKKEKVDESIKLKEVSAFNEDLDELFTRAKESYPIMSVRDKDLVNNYLKSNEKFLIEARKDGRLEGYMLLKYIVRGKVSYLMVMDLFTSGSNITRALIDYLVKKGKDMNVSLVSVWHNNNLNKILKDYNFTFAKSLITVLGKTDLDTEIKGLDKWYLMPIEGEIY